MATKEQRTTTLPDREPIMHRTTAIVTAIKGTKPFRYKSYKSLFQHKYQQTATKGRKKSTTKLVNKNNNA